MYKKSVMHVRSCCFAYQTFFSFFLRSRCRPLLNASRDLEVHIQNMRKRYWREQSGKIFHINTL